MITALLFDFGGTLDGPLHWLDRFLASYRAAGVEISRAELDPAFEHATRTGYGAVKVLARFGLVDLVRFLAGQQIEFLAQHGPDSLRARLAEAGPKGRFRVVEQITASFVNQSRTGLKRSGEILRELKPRYRLGVVSNFYGNLERILAEADLARFIAAVADSSALGIFKPEPGIFRAALDRLRVAPAAAAMIGDSLDKDCAPARRLGLSTVWYRPAALNGAPARGDASVADRTIAALEELVELEWP
jgi:FMN phosphatase YigB (HAD superfamily)